MIDRSALLAALRAQLAAVEADLRERSEEPGLEWAEELRNQYEAAREVGRTALTWSAWRDGEVALAGVAWVLAPVFVQFCADNGLTDKVFIAAPGERMLEAVDAETAFYAADPHRNSRDWLREAFDYLGGFPAAAGLVDAHNPVWSAPLGADACGEILRFWREQDADGALVWSLADPSWDTRFLGDLYQDLSEFAKKKFALLQTPDFVEEFILDRTLNPALEQVALSELRLIDPTCGSGHFLLGAFDRIHEAWLREAPGMDARVRAEKALQAVHGVDINPFAVAIARFRLTLAAMRACGSTTLADAPGFKPQVAVGDSLLAGDEVAGKHEVLDFGDADPDMLLAAHRYAAEDVDDFPGILARKSYHVVVGNPPYITVKDKALNEAYRKRYLTCKGKYALTVPFMELFFELAVRGNGGPAGWVGQITSNSFMKREFGAKLIEDLLSGVDPVNPVDLVELIDSEGAWIPGHNMDGTPTVILIGRRRPPAGATVRAVLSKTRRETREEGSKGQGPYWRTIVEHLDDPGGFDGEYATVTDLARDTLASHPWSLSGGGAVELMARLEGAAATSVGEVAESIGYAAITGEDDVFVSGSRSSPQWLRRGIPTRPFVEGDRIRDFQVLEVPHAIYPYRDGKPLPDLGSSPSLWGWRQILRTGLAFGQTREQRGDPWWVYILPNSTRLEADKLIAFAFVASHNHFSLSRKTRVFKQTAPVIKLPSGAGESEHFGLLALLNSSLACFWLKQVGQARGGSAGVEWSRTYEYTSTRLQDLPLPAKMPAILGGLLDGLASKVQESTPTATLANPNLIPSRETLVASRVSWNQSRARMIALQEELDWHVYRLFGLCDGSVVLDSFDEETWRLEDLPALQPAERAFAIRMARAVAAGVESDNWFTHKDHGYQPVTELPPSWPPNYRALVERRLVAIESNPLIALLERPEFKRRWELKRTEGSDPWEAMETAALTAFILDRLERRDLWFAGGAPQVRSVAQIADAVRHDEAIQAAVELLYGRDADRVAVFTALLADECVPFAAAWRYRPSGMVKRAEWEAVWAMQRREDAGETLDIPVPPKYAQADFRKQSYWKHRGKLDVPKERFIAYPGAQRENDSSAVYGWAGWDHAEAAQALAALLLDRADAQGWEVERLVPLMAGLAELEPWLHQWHAEIHPDYGTSMADEITALLDERLAAAGLTRADVAAWRPPEAGRGRRG